MRLGGARYLHQPITIKTLFENNGTLNKTFIEKNIIALIKDVNVISDEHMVYSVLKKHNIIEENENTVNIINFDKYSYEEQQIIINICYDIINDKNSTNIKQLCDEFHHWCQTKNILPYKYHLQYNNIHLKNLIKEFESNNNQINHNIVKLFISRQHDLSIYIHNYDRILDIIHDCNIDIPIDDIFAKNDVSKIYDVPKVLYECVTIILFYLNNTCPIINTVLNEVYDEFAYIYDIDDPLSDKFSDYILNLKRWSILLDKFKEFGIIDMQHFQIFCYWYNKIIMNKPKEFTSKWEILEFPEYNFDIKNLNLPIPVKNHPDIELKTGFVILLDNLGTKTSDNEKKLLEYWNKLVQNWKKHFGSIYPGGPSLLDRTQFNNFSDTIMITIEDTQDEFIASLNQIGTSLGLFIFDAISMGIFFRGCISYGSYVNSEHARIGKAVTDASLYHESTNWIGVSLSPLAYQKLQSVYKTNMKNNKDSGFDKLYTFRSYVIPLKCGSELGYALYLDRLWRHYKGNNNKLYDILYDGLLGAINHDVSLKYRNTLLFLNSDESTNKPLFPKSI